MEGSPTLRQLNQFQAMVFYLMILTELGAVAHFYDNYFNLPMYNMRNFFNANPWVIPAYWVVMTLEGLVAWQALMSASDRSNRHSTFGNSNRERVSTAKKWLYVFSLMAMFSYGHYLDRPFWQWPLAQNLFILAETVPATLLLISVYRWNNVAKLVAE